MKSFAFAKSAKLSALISFIFVTIIGVIMCTLTPPAFAAGDNGTVHILAFEDMDAILVESNGHFGIIDGGEDSDYPDGSDPHYPLRPAITMWSGAAHEKEVISILKSLGVTSSNLDFYLGTHAHSDHIGAADEIINTFKPKRVYLPIYSDAMITNSWHLWDNQYVYDRALKAAHAVGAQVIQRPNSAERTFALGNLHLTIENYHEITPSYRVEDANDYSWGVLVTDGVSKMFLAGDINNTIGSEDALAKTIGKIDALKLGHHGTSGSNTTAYLRALHPTYAVQTAMRQYLFDETSQTLFDMKTSLFNPDDARKAGISTISFTFTGKNLVPNIKKPANEVIYHFKSASPHVLATYPNFSPAIVSKGWLERHPNYYTTVWYYFDGGTSQAVEHAWRYIGGAWYYFKNDAVMATGWQKAPDGHWYYFDTSTGAMKTGWQWISGKWYYLKPSGAMATGWEALGGSWFYFDKTGAMATGWTKAADNNWYYFDGSGGMKTGWQWIGGKWYYLKSSGAMTTSWAAIGGAWYYFDKTGAMATGWTQTDDGTWYYLQSSGVMKTGWLKQGNTWYYLTSSGAMATGWAALGGTWYYFSENGAMATGWISAPDNNWYYLSGSGVMKTGWQWIGNTWYYLKPSGAMVTGWYKAPDNNWYYFDKSGAMLKNTWVDSYFVDSSGAWIAQPSAADLASATRITTTSDQAATTSAEANTQAKRAVTPSVSGSPESASTAESAPVSSGETSSESAVHTTSSAVHESS